MAEAAESSNSLHIEEYDFNEPVLNKIFYVALFGCINYPLTAKNYFQILKCKITAGYFFVALDIELE